MTLVLRKAFLERVTPFIQFKRFRGKINIQRPKPPHFERATYLALTKPYFINPKKSKTLQELCEGPGVIKREVVDNPFQRIIARELYELIKSSRLVIFFHLNPMKAEDQFKAYASFKKQGMHFKQYGKKTMEMAVKTTPYDIILDFYISHNITLFSPEPNISTVLKITKRFPQLTILAAIYEGKLISKNELMDYSLIPNIQAAQAGFVQTLNSIGGHLINQLNSHQTTLVTNLEERAKQLNQEID